MRDPHVVALNYRLSTAKDVEFGDPPPLEWGTATFDLHLEGGRARAEMKQHYASTNEARAHVEPFLRAWEVHAALCAEGHSEILFEFNAAEIIDRNPPPPPPPGTPIEVCLSTTVLSKVTVDLMITKAAYPEPPRGFVASPDVETLWHRYEGYRNGRELLAGAAYFCLTVLHARGGGRDGAAAKYGIHRDVLSKLGFLTSEFGDERTARKFKSASRPYSPEETQWIDAVVRALIRRVGEYEAAPDLQHPLLTLKDFPGLEDSTGP